MTNIIIPRIFGGIGNQLFIYAAARRLAIVNKAELVLDDVSGFVWDHAYQRNYQLDHFNIPCRKASATERLEPFSRIRRYLKRHINQYRRFEHRHYIQQVGRDFDPRLLLIKPRGKLYIQGYWQSENYFKDVEPIIRLDLKICPPTDEINRCMADQLCKQTAVAVHVRFFDESLAHSMNNVPADYYTRAISKMEAQVPQAHYYIFSDQPELAKKLVSLPNERITLVFHNQGDENAFADLWLMSQCQHFVIANSTFSWWGAWLSDYPEKVIIAPNLRLENGYMTWGFKGLIPEDWHLV